MAAAAREVVGFVRVERDHVQGYRSLKTIKSFWPGEVVLRESPLLRADEDSDLQRLMAFTSLDATKRNVFLSAVSEPEIRDKGCTVHPDQSERTLEAAAELGAKLHSTEAAQVLSRWQYAAHLGRTCFFERASTLRHSCAASVCFECDPETNMGTVTARYTVNPQTRIGVWLLEDASIWWKGANIRSAAVRESGLLHQDCGCERCQGDDTCRAIKCPGCVDFQVRLKAASTLMVVCSSAVLMASFVGWRRVCSGFANIQRGEVTRNGKLKRWRCNKCDFNASDTAVEGYVKIESALVDELSDLSSLPSDQLVSWADTVNARVGWNHWLAPALWMEIYRRQVDKGGGELSFVAVLATLRLCEWYLSRNLTKPPQPVIDKLAEMMFNTLDFLQNNILGVRDMRVLYLRAIDMFRNLIESIDKSLSDRFKPFAGAAQNIRRRCGFCQKFMREDVVVQEPVDISADDDTARPTYCAFCTALVYCDMGCQLADWKRHRFYCIPMNMDFRSEHVGNILTATC